MQTRSKATAPEGTMAPGHTPTRLSLGTLLLGEQDCSCPGEDSVCLSGQPQDLCTGLMGVTDPHGEARTQPAATLILLYISNSVVYCSIASQV